MTVRRLFFRITNAFKIFWWAVKNPNVLNESNFKMLSGLLELILNVSTSGNPRMTKIACIHPDEGSKDIVSIWAGAGMGADPTKRISELHEEISKLKAVIIQQGITPK